MTIDLIPTNVLGEIFSLIGSSDVKSCRQVCKKWKKAINADILKRFIGPYKIDVMNKNINSYTFPFSKNTFLEKMTESFKKFSLNSAVKIHCCSLYNPSSYLTVEMKFQNGNQKWIEDDYFFIKQSQEQNKTSETFYIKPISSPQVVEISMTPNTFTDLVCGITDCTDLEHVHHTDIETIGIKHFFNQKLGSLQK